MIDFNALSVAEEPVDDPPGHVRLRASVAAEMAYDVPSGAPEVGKEMARGLVRRELWRAVYGRAYRELLDLEEVAVAAARPEQALVVREAFLRLAGRLGPPS